ncbi:MAG TPA: hypothetical protein VHD60_03020 [Candidatus Saccharimonadales bacterium]|nr:hypothetical protein [Candidatus Saccharimonadales bacterium]
MYSTERTSLVIEPHVPVDEPWNSQLRAVAEQERAAHELLQADPATLANEKETFFSSGHTYNPDLRPRHIDETVMENEAELLSFKEQLRADTSLEPTINQAYRWRVNEIIAERRMVKAAQEGDKRRFEAYNHFIYGAPDKEIFAATADWFRAEAQALLAHENESVREAAQHVLEMVPDLNGNRFALVPDSETFQKIQKRHNQPSGHFALLFNGVELPERGLVTPDIGEPILEKVRENLHANDYSITDAAGTVWSVSHGRKELQRPAQYRMPLKRLVGLGPGHEWTHVLERINGDRQPLRLSGFGLDRYEQGNEGRAVIREQVPFDSFEAFSRQLRWQDILRRHFAISIAEGLGREKGDFSHTYAVINAVDRLWERQKDPDNIAKADQKADDRTWALLATRIMRGTDGTGGAYLKDKVYLEGNIACWKVARENPELIEAGDLAKFDIANSRHIALLQATGVLPRQEDMSGDA